MTTRIRIKAGYGRASVLDAMMQTLCPGCALTFEHPGRSLLKGTLRCPACGHRQELAEHVRRSLWFEHARAYGARSQGLVAELAGRRVAEQRVAAPAAAYPGRSLA